MMELAGDMSRSEADDALRTSRVRKSARGAMISSSRLENALLDGVARMRGLWGREMELIEGRLLKQALSEPGNLDGSLSRSIRSGDEMCVNDWKWSAGTIATPRLHSPNPGMRCRIAWT
jgi:hypothetical protein